MQKKRRNIFDIGEEKIFYFKELDRVFEHHQLIHGRNEEVFGNEIVILTGSTGFLGVNVLCELLLLDTVVNVFCFISCESIESGFKRLEINLKECVKNKEYISAYTRRSKDVVKIIQCNYKRKNWGIEDYILEDLCSSCTRIFHIGSPTNLVMGYEKMSKLMINGFLFVTEIAIRNFNKNNTSRSYYIPLYVSSSCSARVVEAYSSTFQPDHGLYRGYAQSKYIINTLAFRMFKKYGFPIKIFDISYLTLSNSPENLYCYKDSIESIWKLSLEMKKCFNSNFSFDYVEVEKISKKIIKITTLSNKKKNGFYYNLHSNHQLKWKDITIEGIRKIYPSTELVSLEEFRESMEKLLMIDDKKYGKLRYLLKIVSNNFFEHMDFLFKNVNNSSLVRDYYFKQLGDDLEIINIGNDIEPLSKEEIFREIEIINNNFEFH